MKKLIITIICVLVAGFSFAEDYQVIVNKYPGRTLETYPEYYVDQIKRVTIVNVSNTLAATESAAALTVSNNTAALAIYEAAAVLPTVIDTDDTITAMQTAAGDTYSNMAHIVEILGVLDGAGITNVLNITTAISNNAVY